MSIWSSWNSFLRSFTGRTSLTRTRRQHILRRNRRSFLESLVNRQVMTGLPPTITGLTANTAGYNEHAWFSTLTTSGTVDDVDSANFNLGSLTATISSGTIRSGDVLGVKHVGTGAGQIAVTNTTFNADPAELTNTGTVKYANV